MYVVTWERKEDLVPKKIPWVPVTCIKHEWSSQHRRLYWLDLKRICCIRYAAHCRQDFSFLIVWFGSCICEVHCSSSSFAGISLFILSWPWSDSITKLFCTSFRISPSRTIGLTCKIHKVGEDHLCYLNSTLELKGKSFSWNIQHSI